MIVGRSQPSSSRQRSSVRFAQPISEPSVGHSTLKAVVVIVAVPSAKLAPLCSSQVESSSSSQPLHRELNERGVAGVGNRSVPRWSAIGTSVEVAIE